MKAAVDGRSVDSLCVSNLLFDATVLSLFFSRVSLCPKFITHSWTNTTRRLLCRRAEYVGS